MSLVSQESNLQSDSSTGDEKSGFECGLLWQKIEPLRVIMLTQEF